MMSSIGYRAAKFLRNQKDLASYSFIPLGEKLGDLAMDGLINVVNWLRGAPTIGSTNRERLLMFREQLDQRPKAAVNKSAHSARRSITAIPNDPFVEFAAGNLLRISESGGWVPGAAELSQKSNVALLRLAAQQAEFIAGFELGAAMSAAEKGMSDVVAWESLDRVQKSGGLVDQNVLDAMRNGLAGAGVSNVGVSKDFGVDIGSSLN